MTPSVVKSLGVVYLASPYSHESSSVRRQRWSAARIHAALILSLGGVVYSPIAMTHDMSGDLPQTWDFWRRPSLAMLERMDSLVVLTLSGWQESVGVEAEIEFARSRYKTADEDIPVKYLQPWAMFLTDLPSEGV